MTDFRAYVDRSNFANLSLNVRIVSGPYSDVTGKFSQAVKELASENGTVFERVLEFNELPKILLDEDVAKALMLGLLEYFGEYKGDVRILRQDYQAERKRVDEFIKYLTRSQ